MDYWSPEWDSSCRRKGLQEGFNALDNPRAVFSLKYMILCKIITNQADDVGESHFIARWIGIYRPVSCNHVGGFNAEDLFPGNFVAMETRASLLFSVWCFCFSSKTWPAQQNPQHDCWNVLFYVGTEENFVNYSWKCSVCKQLFVQKIDLGSL